MARCQVYGGREADEFRSGAAVFSDRLADNEVAEGDHVAVLRRMASERVWDRYEAYTQRLLKEGHSKARVDSMVSRSTAGMRF